MAYVKVNLQSGDIIGQVDLSHIEDGIAAAAVKSDVDTALAAKAPAASPTFTGVVTGITKSMVGLGNVDNTSDVNKPLSSAMTTALAAKAPLESPNFTGTPKINGVAIGTGSGGGSSTPVDAYTKAQTDAFFVAYNQLPRIEYTGTRWPDRTLPTNYTGPILWDSELFDNAPAPTNAVENDRWARHSTSDIVGTTITTVPLVRQNNTFTVNGSPIRLSGANAYWLGLDDNNGTSSGSFPSKTQITNAMAGMSKMGVNLVRAHTVGMSAGTSKSFETAPGVYVGANLDAADWAVYQAKLKGIYLMVPLTDNWNYYHGGKWNFVHWAYQQNPSGLTDTPGTTKDDVNERVFFANTAPGLRVRALFKDYIANWLAHVNPYTGLAYKDDPTIAIIETGNEIYYAAQTGSDEWTQDIASYIKSIAPNKLVADGSAADRVAVSSQPGITATAIDVLGAHYYPQQQSGSYPPINFTATGSGYPAGTAIQQLTADAAAATNANKPFIVGEYPWTRSDVSSFYSTVENSATIDGDMFWSFIPNTDAGVPEVHGGAFGSDDYPVHYPYSGANEQQYAPALAQHIKTVTTS